jgi:hypothetical protein
MMLPALFALVVGMSMIGQWTALFLSGEIPELETEPYRISFHLAGEGLTAVLLILGGLGLWLSWPWAQPLYLVAGGMLLYTAIVSPGYFVQQGQPIWLAIFLVIVVLSVYSLFTVAAW